MKLKLDEELTNIEGTVLEILTPVATGSKVLTKTIDQINTAKKNIPVNPEEITIKLKEIEMLLNNSLLEVEKLTYRKVFITALKRSDTENVKDCLSWYSLFEKLRPKNKEIVLDQAEIELLLQAVSKLKKIDIEPEAKIIIVGLLSNKKEK